VSSLARARGYWHMTTGTKDRQAGRTKELVAINQGRGIA
jgi:hypothetical protein